jgi:ribosomal protein S18 acetylase RimI-like enzyme
MEFRQAVDALAAHQLMARCGIAMEERYGLTTWRPPRPVRLIEPHVDAGETWEGIDDGRVVAMVTLSADPPSFYDDSYFDPAGEPARYLSMLAVEPTDQGRGIGRACVEWAVARASQANARSVRLDTAGENEPAQRFFLRLGFAQRSPVLSFPRFTLVYFERVL